jgi:hypothetical protein
MYVGFANSRKIEQLKVSVDGKLAALLQATAEGSHAEGVAQGKVDAAMVSEIVQEAMAKALSAPAPVGIVDLKMTSEDTNKRIRDVQEKAAGVAAALAAREKEHTEQ